MNLAIFGGSFNPPHVGHEMIIEYCYNSFDRLLIIPNRTSPEKKNDIYISELHKVKMLNMIIGNKDIDIDTFEIKSKQDNYTYYTLKYLMENYKFSNLYMIIGEDQLLNLSNWYKVDFILDNVEIVCFKRASFNYKNKIFNNIKYIPFDYPFSSSGIRRMIKEDILINDGTINQDVYKYIIHNNLYKGP